MPAGAETVAASSTCAVSTGLAVAAPCLRNTRVEFLERLGRPVLGLVLTNAKRWPICRKLRLEESQDQCLTVLLAELEQGAIHVIGEAMEQGFIRVRRHGRAQLTGDIFAPRAAGLSSQLATCLEDSGPMQPPRQASFALQERRLARENHKHVLADLFRR